MTRTTVTIPDQLLKQLRLIAAKRGVSMAAIVREALEEKIDEGRPRPRFIGMADSGYTDSAHLAGEVRAKPRSWR